MVDKIKFIGLDLSKYPYVVVAYDNNDRPLRTWKYKTTSEAKKALNDITKELLEIREKQNESSSL